MKPLIALNNVEKAKLLHSLFPCEIPELLQFTKGMCLTIIEEQEQQRKSWDNGFFSFDLWLSFVTEVNERIKKYGNKLDKSSSLFADQLFDGYNAMFMVNCLTFYTTIKKHSNQKFVLAIDLLFNS